MKSVTGFYCVHRCISQGTGYGDIQMKNQLLRAYMELNRGAIGEEFWNDCFEEVDWERLFAVSQNRMTAVLCSNVVAKLGAKGTAPEDIVQKWADYSGNHFLSEYIRWDSIRRLLNRAAEKNIELIMFKGYILAQLYPSFGMRNSSDTDFLVRKEQLDEIKELLAEEYDFVQECSKEQVLTYRHRENGHSIEIHLQLWEDYEGSRIDILKSLRLDSEDSLIKCEVYGQQLITLNETKHLIYQIFHVVKHFSVEGLGTRYLIDISLFCNHYYNKISWDEFWRAMELLHYTEFSRQFFSLGIKYFGLRRDIVGEDYIENIPDEESILMDMMLGGFVSAGQKGEFQIWGIMTPYLTGDITPAASKFGRMLQTMFPSAENIRDDFSYAKRHKILLPIAWVHRFIDYLFYKKAHPDESYAVDEKLAAAEYRIGQLKKRGLL